MWVNLHNLPPGQAMYTVAVTAEPAGTPRDQVCVDEIDVVASTRLTSREVAELAREEIERDYVAGCRVVGVSNQSDGYVMWQDADGDLLAAVAP